MRIMPTMNNQNNATSQKRQPDFKGIVSLEVRGIEDSLINYLPKKFNFLAKASGASELLSKVEKHQDGTILSQRFVLWCKDNEQFQKLVKQVSEASEYLQESAIFRSMTKEITSVGQNKETEIMAEL